MRGRGGVILNMSSVHAAHAWPGEPAYDASKAGLVALTRSMAIDHGRDGIRVNAVCPGYIRTPMVEQWLLAEADPEAVLRRVVGFHPVGRIGTAW